MGGGLASLFAVLSNAGKLSLNKTVDRLYGMAPVPLFRGRYGMPVNKQTEDGCFAGGIYCNYVDEQGALKIDPACNKDPGYYMQPKVAFTKIGAASGTVACSDVTRATFDDETPA